MAIEESMTQAIIQAVIEAAKTVTMAIIEANNPISNTRPVHATPRSGGPTQKHLTFEWKLADKYQELCNFKIEVKNIFMTKSYNIKESEMNLIILNCLGWEGLRLVQTLNKEELEGCLASIRLFEVLNEKFKPQHNETILCHDNVEK